MDCRNILCDAKPVGFIRVNHTFKGGEVLDDDWLYCRYHLDDHHNGNPGTNASMEFHFNLEGVRL